MLSPVVHQAPDHCRAACRGGTILVLAALMLVALLAATALVVDVGMMSVTNARLQAAADASSLSAAQSMIQSMDSSGIASIDTSSASSVAQSVCRQHAGAAPGAILNLPEHDIMFVSTGANGSGPTNAVQVTVRRDGNSNAQLPMSFATVFGRDSVSLKATATAGFFPAGELTAGAEVLPIAVDATIWSVMQIGNDLTNQIVPFDVGELEAFSILDILSLVQGETLLEALGVPVTLEGNPLMLMDRRCWRPDSQSVITSPDGVWEGLFLPQQLRRTSLFQSLLNPLLGIEYIPGNMVVVNLGDTSDWSAGVNIAKLERQLVSALDFNDVAGINALNGNNSDSLTTPFVVQGQYKLPPEIEDELRAAIGKPRILLLYATIPGVLSTVGDLLNQPTNFVIVGWVGAVVTDVEFDALLHYVKFQPAPYASFSLRRPPEGTPLDFSSGVYAGPYLIE